MRKILVLCVLMSAFVSCKSSDRNNSTIVAGENKVEKQLIIGAERFDEYLPILKNKRVGLVVNQTSVVNNTHLVDTLLGLGVNIIKVFAPEHGFRGNHSAGAVIKNGLDEKSGLSVVSLYGKNKKPTEEMLIDLDVVVFDIQDVGVRFYTYISTMHYVMEACAENNKKVIVLDRPNPNGFYVDGPVLDLKYQSFIGMHAIPIVHGLTVGELANMINSEKWLKGGITCDVAVISCLNYNHQDLYQLPIKPSPNLPNMNSVYLYPYLGLFEGTNVSIGRGTDRPFQIVGRPGEFGKLQFKPMPIPGVSDHPKHEGEICGGEVVLDAIDSTLFKSPKLNLEWLVKFYKTNSVENGPYFKNFFYKLTGTSSLKTQIERGLTDYEIRSSWKPKLDEYNRNRKKYLLYP